MTVDGWTPTALVWRDGHPRFELRDLRGVHGSDPFFEQTVERALREPYRLLFPREVDVGALPAVPAARPAGFIFHGSRCGSTLLASMLGCLEDAVVISEAAVVDQILRAPAGAEARADWLARALAALARHGGSEPGRCFVKLDSWSIGDLSVVRSAFPDVPWVFVYRRPDEVLRSQLRVRGMQMVPGVIDPARFGLDAAQLGALAPEEYCARVLAAIYTEAAAGLGAGGGRLVNHDELPEPGAGAVLAHFGIAPDAGERSRMQAMTRWDAKHPRLCFDAARPPVAPAARAAADRWAAAPYARLEELRAAC